jgi:ABC-type sugar transport system ATPase subunit
MPGTTVLEVELASRLTFAENEVVGLFGMAAGPQFAVLDALFGLTHTPPVAQLDGMPYRPSTPRIAIRAGVHLVPGDREQDGLVAAMSAADNVRLPWLFRRKRSNQSTSTTYVKARADLAILGPGADAPIAEFSGGNRQKHLLARWIYPSRPRVLLLAQPTQGVDISAKSDIRRVVRHLAGEGTAVLVASAETDEIATMCDRAYVFFGSHIVEIPRTDDFDEQLLHTLLDLANLPNETKLEPA